MKSRLLLGKIQHLKNWYIFGTYRNVPIFKMSQQNDVKFKKFLIIIQFQHQTHYFERCFQTCCIERKRRTARSG